MKAVRWHYAVAAILLAFLFAVNVRRAVAQSVTVDEALTYNHFIAAPASDPMRIAAPFNVNLGTTLSRWSVKVFGPSDLALRLPAVLSGAVYFIALFAICRLLFPSPPLFLLAIAVNSLNPYLLDYFSAARGYGPAIAFWTTGAYFCLRRRPLAAGIAFGLSIASHISAIFAVAGMEAAYALVLAVSAEPWRRTAKQLAVLFAATAVIASLILWTPMSGANTGSIDGVVGQYLEGLKTLATGFVFYQPTPLAPWELLHRRVLWPFAALAAALLFAIGRVIARGRRISDETDSHVLLFGTAVALTFGLLAVEPRLFHHGYFAERRLLATLPVLFLAATLVLRVIPRPAALAGAGLLLWLTAIFVLEFQTASYLGWEQDASTRQAMDALRKQSPAAGPASLGAGPFLEESLNYERALRGPVWLKPVVNGGFECSHDFYYLLESDFDRVKRFGVEPVYRSALSRTVLAGRSAEAKRRKAALAEMGFTTEPVCEADLMTDFEVLDNERPESARAMLRDVMPGATGKYRWTYHRPAFLMHTPGAGAGTVRFELRFGLHSAVFAKTGPVALTVFVNGRPIGTERYTQPEEHTFSKPVPAEALRKDGLALVETSLDQYMTGDDGQRLGYLFMSAAFR